MSKSRADWKFHYPVDEVRAGAEAKVKHHSERLAWWEGQQVEAETRIRATGITVDVSLANQVSNSYSRGGTVTVDTKMVHDLDECAAKVREHRAKVEEYGGWVEVLIHQEDGTRLLRLSHADWLYFFGGK